MKFTSCIKKSNLFSFYTEDKLCIQNFLVLVLKSRELESEVISNGSSLDMRPNGYAFCITNTDSFSQAIVDRDRPIRPQTIRSK